jgi:hypothetical protein
MTFLIRRHTLKAPQYERADMLRACINRAAYELSDPIDRIEVLSNKIVVSAGSQRVVLIARYANAIRPSGAVAPGSGQWVVDVAESEP